MLPLATVVAASLVLWVTASVLVLCYRQLWGSTPRYGPDDFIRRLLPALRKLERNSSYYDYGARELAEAFEWLLAHPADVRRPTCAGDETTDREIVALWLDRHAHGPAFTAPPWTRLFSEQLAWVLRHRRPITEKNLLDAQRAIRHEHSARWARLRQQARNAH